VDAHEQSGAELVRQVRRRVQRVGWGANGLGALVVAGSIAFLVPVFIDPGELPEFALLNGPLVVSGRPIDDVVRDLRAGLFA